LVQHLEWAVSGESLARLLAVPSVEWSAQRQAWVLPVRAAQRRAVQLPEPLARRLGWAASDQVPLVVWLAAQPRLVRSAVQWERRLEWVRQSERRLAQQALAQ
jgi:hypothetical protein